jgi:hypothetical protein
VIKKLIGEQLTAASNFQQRRVEGEEERAAAAQ